MSEILIYVNGKLIPKSEAKISVFDEGVTHGWAVYEGIRVYDGRVLELDAHIRRLYASANSAGIEVPISPALFRDAITKTIRANGYKDCHLAPWVGYGELGGDLFLDLRLGARKPADIDVADQHKLISVQRLELSYVETGFGFHWVEAAESSLEE